MVVERFSKTGLALLMLAIGFFVGVAVGFLGAYHGSNFWYREFKKENEILQERVTKLRQAEINELERAIKLYMKEIEDAWPENGEVK